MYFYFILFKVLEQVYYLFAPQSSLTIYHSIYHFQSS